jgi:cob(I)alamin adenosyltransferase
MLIKSLPGISFQSNNFKTQESKNIIPFNKPLNVDTFERQSNPNYNILSFKGLDKGKVRVITGNGRGKTTGAIGQGIRAAGQDNKVKMIQFAKGPKNVGDKSFYGEVNLANKYLPKDIFSIEQFGADKILLKNALTDKDIQGARKGWERAKSVIEKGENDVVILDELNICMDFGMIKPKEVIEVLENRPKHVEVIITGSFAPQEIMDYADSVDEINSKKHPTKMSARKGIEF